MTINSCGFATGCWRGSLLGLLLLLLGCASDSTEAGGPDPSPSLCGNRQVDEGEVCDEVLGSSNHRCANDCASACGNGTVEAREVCDDGNLKDGDGCSDDCREACGNGQVEAGETCDDANDALGDGCYACETPGNVLWQAAESCDGDTFRGNNDTIIVACLNDPTLLFRRFTLGGTQSAGPPPPLEANEAINQPTLIAEQPSGELYLATQIQRNDSAPTQSRVRLYRLNADGSTVWSTDLTMFPGERSEYPHALATGPGMVALAGLSQADIVDNKPFVALVKDDGTLAWKVLMDMTRGDARAVAIGDDGVVYAGGGSDQGIDGIFRTVWVSAFDPGGEVLWSWTSPIGYHGAIGGMRLSADSVEIITQLSSEDSLVPNPPRFDSIWDVKRLDRATGAVTATVYLTSKRTEGRKWRDFEGTLPKARFSNGSWFDSYTYSREAIVGYHADGTQAWTSIEPPPAPASSAIAIEHLLCTAGRAKFGGVVELFCYLTQ